MVAPTDWKARITPHDVLGDDGKALVVSWLPGSDDVVSVGLGPMLDEGESLTDVAVTVWRLRNFDEAADVDKTADLLVEHEVVGTDVLARLSELEAGRWYKLRVLYGAAGNRRGNTMLIHAEEG